MENSILFNLFNRKTLSQNLQIIYKTNKFNTKQEMLMDIINFIYYIKWLHRTFTLNQRFILYTEYTVYIQGDHYRAKFHEDLLTIDSNHRVHLLTSFQDNLSIII